MSEKFIAPGQIQKIDKNNKDILVWGKCQLQANKSKYKFLNSEYTQIESRYMVQTYVLLFFFYPNYCIDHSSVKFFSKRGCFGKNFRLKRSEKTSTAMDEI